MKKLFVLVLLLLLGAGVGAGTAYGVAQVMGPPPKVDHHAAPAPEVDTVFVPTGAVLVPVVTGDGVLSGYASFEVQLEVEEERSADVAATGW